MAFLNSLLGFNKQNARQLTEIVLANGNGYGSTGTTVRVFATVKQVNTSGAQFRKDPVMGDSIIVGRSGYYYINWVEYSLGANSSLAITKNATQLSTSPSSFSDLFKCIAVCQHLVNANGASGHCAFMGWLNKGDVIRFQAAGGVQDSQGDFVSRAIFRELPLVLV